jgi:hypothetical protein
VIVDVPGQTNQRMNRQSVSVTPVIRAICEEAFSGPSCDTSEISLADYSSTTILLIPLSEFGLFNLYYLTRAANHHAARSEPSRFSAMHCCMALKNPWTFFGSMERVTKAWQTKIRQNTYTTTYNLLKPG